MAHVFISESSRRPQQITEDEMEKKWSEAFGEKKKMICSRCKRPVHKVASVNDSGPLCYDCLRQTTRLEFRV